MATNVVWTLDLVLEAFQCDIRCSRRQFVPNNSASPAIFVTSIDLYEERRKVTTTAGYLITVTMFQPLTSSLFDATALSIPIQVHTGPTEFDWNTQVHKGLPNSTGTPTAPPWIHLTQLFCRILYTIFYSSWSKTQLATEIS